MILKEGYREKNELGKLATEIIQYFGNENYSVVKTVAIRTANGNLDSESKKIVFETDTLFVDTNFIKDISKYPTIKELFIKRFAVGFYNISSSGIYSSTSSNTTNPTKNLLGIIKLKYPVDLFDQIKDHLGIYELKDEWDAGRAKALLRVLLGYNIRKTLEHELQHAFDDCKSNGKYASDVKSKKYYGDLKYNPLDPNSTMDKATRDIYLTLPHEYWARFASYDTAWHRPFDEVLKDFKSEFDGFNLLSQANKNRLLKAVYKYWSLEQEKDIKEMKKTDLLQLIADALKDINTDISSDITEDYMSPPEPQIRPAIASKDRKYRCMYFFDRLAILKDNSGVLWLFDYTTIDDKDFAPYADREITYKGKSKDEEEYKDEDIDIDYDVIENYINDGNVINNMGSGLDDYEGGKELIKMDDKLSNYIIDELVPQKNKDKVKSILNK